MGAPRVRRSPDLASRRQRRDGSPVDIVDFAVTQVLGDDTVLDALPAVLARLISAFDVRAALAIQPQAAGPATVLAVQPRNGPDPALIEEIRGLSVRHRGAGAGCVEVPLGSGGRGMSVLLTYSAPVGGECLCALALIGAAASWDEEIRSTAHAVAAVVSAQIRHANDVAVLAEGQELTRALIAGSPNAILAFDEDRHMVEFNPAAEQLSGRRRDDVLGKEMSGLFIPEQGRVGFVAHTATYLGSGDPGEFTGPMRAPFLRADGTELQVELTPVQVSVDGRTIFCGFLRDVTELERSHAALADQTERLNCLIATAIPGVLVTDEQGQITQVSESFCVMFGIEAPDRLVGTPVSETIRRIKGVFADPGEFIRRASEAFSARQPVAGEQIAFADGRTVECDYWPMLIDGRYRGDLWLAWDVSDRKALDEQRERMLAAELAARRAAQHAQRRLAEQNTKLRELDEAKSQFIATVSHELRTPLTSIISFSELIMTEADRLTADGARFLGIIVRNADRLLSLVGDLLLLSRLEAGVLPLERVPVAIPELVAEAVRAASASAAEHGVTIEIEAGAGPAAQADPARLRQVLDNLIANAVKFSHAGGLVRVAAACDEFTWRIDVTDSGIGIPPNEVGQLFTRFVRASNARIAGLPGTGLGLSIVKAIVELHGGRVEVKSTLGRGTTFSIHLKAGT